jgi:hypothetical protein
VSNNQASSPNYLIPVALVVLSLITSVLFSQIYLQDDSDSDVLSEERSESQEEGQREEQAAVVSEEPELADSSSDIPDSADQPAPGAEPVAEPQSGQDQQATGETAQAQEQEKEQSDVSVIADLALLVPGNNALCDGQNPWGSGNRRLSELDQPPGCYGLRFELAKPATVLLLKLGEGAAPRSLLAQNCRPFGFNSARFEPEQVQRLPRGVNAQPGVFQVGSAPVSTRFVLVAASQPPEQLATLEAAVANLCGQSATLTNEEVQTQLDQLAELASVSIAEVRAKL